MASPVAARPISATRTRLVERILSFRQVECRNDATSNGNPPPQFAPQCRRTRAASIVRGAPVVLDTTRSAGRTTLRDRGDAKLRQECLVPLPLPAICMVVRIVVRSLRRSVHFDTYRFNGHVQAQ